MDTPLSIRACLKYGWETFKKRPWYLVGVTLLIGLINLIIPNPQDDAAVPALISIGLISFLLSTFVQTGTTYFSLRAHDAVENVELKDLWQPRLFPRFLLATILVAIIAGLAFLIPIGLAVLLYPVIGYFSLIALVLLIPAIIIAVALSFVTYLVVDRGTGPVRSIKDSIEITKGHRGKLLLLSIAIGLINIVGLLLLVVGLLVTLPVSIIAFVHAYRTLEETKPVLPTVAEPVAG